eukprot:CAMPEP_0170647856 /NCGR_PEP_ID=MMETSP0224-20130122/44410_1 /TAXON_ID=285029 /ORGANISM="Togula jolla, Strain CCCM 725" /LENGTH=71 /DNA_ID=CAMNT_0010979315 /DNA_START=171 /DNA_END=382 /DNA_ORIENTATION=-
MALLTGYGLEGSSPALWTVEMVLVAERVVLIVAAASWSGFRILLRVDEARSMAVQKDALKYLRLHKVSHAT